MSIHARTQPDPPPAPTLDVAGTALPAPACFTVGMWAGNGRLRLLPVGDLNYAGVGEFNARVRLAVRTGLPVIIDCRELTSIDCAGAIALLEAVDHGATLKGDRQTGERLLGTKAIADPAASGHRGPADWTQSP